MAEYIKNVHGEKAWAKVKEQLQLEQVISIKLIVQQRYPWQRQHRDQRWAYFSLTNKTFEKESFRE